MNVLIAVLLWILRIVGILLGLAVLLILLLLFCKTKLDLEYRDGKARMRLRFLFLRLTLFPQKKKKERAPKPTPPETEKKEAPETEGKIKKTIKRFTFHDYIAILQTVAEKFLAKFRCELLILHAAIGGEDAMQAAMEYGRINALVYPILGALAAGNALKKADVQITPDFASEETRAEGRAVFSIRLFHTIPCIITLYKKLF